MSAKLEGDGVLLAVHKKYHVICQASWDSDMEDVWIIAELDTKQAHDVDILDKVLRHLGGIGRYQKLIFVAMIPRGFTYAFVYYMQMFIVLIPQDHWCRIPELTDLSMELKRNLSAPRDASGGWNHCMTFDTNWTRVLDTLTPPLEGTTLIPCQHGWEFKLDDIPYETIVTERLWVCEHASYVPTAQSIFFAGSIVGSFIFGFMADRFGRIPVIMSANLIAGIGCIATTFTTGFWDFLFCSFLTGLAFDNCYMALYILFVEYVGPEYRSLLANFAYAFTYAISGMVLPWIAYSIADWRKLLWLSSLPTFLILLMPWIIPESASWLLSKGNIHKAIRILKKFEYINGTKIPDDLLEEFVLSSNQTKMEEKESLLSLRKSPLLMKAMVCLMILFLGITTVADGLIRISGSFGITFFAVFSFNAAIEFTAILIVAFILDRWGRRNVTGGLMFLAGVALAITVCLPEGLPQAGLTVVARLFVMISFTCTLQWSIEILPTPFRASGSSIIHLSIFFSMILSTFIAYLERFWDPAPLLIYTAITFLTVGVTLTLPETRGLPLPQTLADAEKNIRELSFYRTRK